MQFFNECPKKRFLFAENGEYGLNYLCEAYKMFFSHTAPVMRFMANELVNSRAPQNVMSGQEIMEIEKLEDKNSKIYRYK